VDFSLGDSIAALGLVVAVYGLFKARWRLNFALNPRYKWSVLGLVLLGVTAPFVAFSLRPLNLPYLNVVEGMAWVFFFCAAIDFARCAFWTGPLYLSNASEKAKVRFIRYILNTAILSDSDSLNAVVTIMRNSVDEICADVKRFHHYDPDEEREEDLAAYLLQTLLGETKVINYIIENRIDFIFELVGALKRHHVDSYSISVATESLMTALYVNPKSYLYQQLGYDGFTNYLSIYELIFEDEQFVTNYHPISHWFGIGTRVSFKSEVLNDPRYVEVFLKGYTRSLEKFAYSNQGNQMVDQLRRGMDGLADYVEALAMDMWNKEYDYFSPSGQSLHKVVHFVGHDFYFDVFSKKAEAGKITEDELNPSLETDQWHEGVSGAFARLFYQVIESISMIHGPSENERMAILEIDETFLGHISTHPYVEGVRKKILHLLWEKSEGNITHGWYPVVFRAICIVFFPQFSNMPTWAIHERDKMIDTLRNKVKPRILRNELMANDKTPKEKDLLPESFVFDHDNGKFFSVDSHGNRSELRKS
jgi:hypothetical protein